MQQAAANIAEPGEKGRLGIVYLKRIWSSVISRSVRGGLSPIKDEGDIVSSTFDVLGIGLEPTFKYLFIEKPSFETFENWVEENGVYSSDMIEMFNKLVLNDQATPFTIDDEHVLDNNDLAQWEKDGYIILKNVVPREACEEAVDMIYKYLEMDPSDPTTWYKPHSARQGIMIQLFRHPLLDKIRLTPKIRYAYQQLWQRKDLMVSMDRISFNPPSTTTYPFPGPDLHWDVSLKMPIRFGLQGLLYLVDTAENQGAFTLVPGFQHKIGDWLNGLPHDVNPRDEDLHALGSKPIAANAGDFILWHHALPHGSSPNMNTKPRIVQYINYRPLIKEACPEWI